MKSIKWTGNDNDPVRKCVFLSDAGCLLRPNDLRPVMSRDITPRLAYAPLADGWEPLAKMDLKDGFWY
jgi:hypothetical protein